MKVKNIQFIDFAKGLSILSIVLYHYSNILVTGGLLKKVIMAGGAGVHMFILISGFGLYLSEYKNSFMFYKRRFIKIMVPYYLVITFIFIINTIFELYPFGLYEYLSHIFIFKMFSTKAISSFGVQFWFMSTIIQLYLAYPLLLWLKGRLNSNIKFIISMFTISIVWMSGIVYFGLDSYRVWNSFFVQYLWEFCLGMVLADMYYKYNYQFWNKYPIHVLLSTFCTGLTLMALTILGFQRGAAINDIFSLMWYCSFCILAYEAFNKYNKYLLKIIISFGKISYSVFLVHMFFIALLLHLGSPNNAFERILIVLIAFTLSIISSILLNRFLKGYITDHRRPIVVTS